MLERHSGHFVELMFTAFKNVEYMDSNTTTSIFSCDSSSICDNACNVVVDVVVVVRLFCQKCVNEFFSSK